MTQRVDDSEPLIPPFPNLGPEPLAEPRWPLPLLVGVLLLLLGGIAVLWIRRLQRRRSARPSGVVERPDSLDGLPPEVSWTESLREALVARFDESWRAKTTEEIAGSEEIGAILGNEAMETLIALFRASDLAKFGGPPRATGDSQGVLGAWPDSARALREAIAGGARSSTTGK